MSLSVVVSAYNEEGQIEDCLKSASFAQEIVVVDNQSTDKTVEIAKRYTAKIFSRPNNPMMLNLSKNFGFTKAKGEWILSLDADERISEELRKEIEKHLQALGTRHQVPVGFLIPRKNIIFGKWIQHGLWYPDYQLRLFRRDKGEFPGKHNHELLVVEGETEKLREHIIHFNYTSINQYLYKLTSMYSDNEVKNFLDSGKSVHWYEAIRMPASDFLANFFAREGYKDGLHGLVLALLQSFYTLIVFCKIWETQKFWEYNPENFLGETKEEMVGKGKELHYWLEKNLTDNEGPAKRLINKLKMKLLS